jgi:hypothetical protein
MIRARLLLGIKALLTTKPRQLWKIRTNLSERMRLDLPWKPVSRRTRKIKHTAPCSYFNSRMQEMAPSDVQAPTGTPAYDDEDDEDLARRLQLSVTDTFDSVAIIAHALNVPSPENGGIAVLT